MRIFSLLTDTTQPGLIEIEFHARFQIPSFQILGLPAPEIQEAKERVMAAFQASNFEFPKKKVVINLAPASVKKSGTGHDLSIALKILTETIEQEWPEDSLAWGELSLEGEVKAAGKMATLIELLLKQPLNANPHLFLHPSDFEQLKTLLRWRQEMKLPNPLQLRINSITRLADFEKIVLAPPLRMTNEKLKPIENKNALGLLALAPGAERILKIGLIGKHHVLLLGPKGIGKSESIRWYQALLPDSKPDQTWTRILTSESRNLPLDFAAPVRRVHAQVKPAHLLGSFNERGFLPGELALAHGGLFIADEFMEWPRDSKECLREPLQSKKVFLSRVRGQIECPSDFQMIATGNLCPCGGLPENFRTHAPIKKFRCRCKASEVENYFHKLSGPILDRIDLTFIMTENEVRKPQLNLLENLKKEISDAQKFSMRYFGNLASDLEPEWLDENLPKSLAIEKILSDVTSLRARHKILRVARSIQALDQQSELKEAHVFEAKWYRLLTEETI